MFVKKIENSADLQQAMQIRRTVFVEEQGVPASEEYDGYDDDAQHYIAIHERQSAGTARWRRTEGGVKLERFAVLADHRRRGVGAALLDAVMKDVQKVVEHKPTIYIHAQVQAIPFWERGGFHVVGAEFMEADIPHFKMVFGVPKGANTIQFAELALV